MSPIKFHLLERILERMSLHVLYRCYNVTSEWQYMIKAELIRRTKSKISMIFLTSPDVDPNDKKLVAAKKRYNLISNLEFLESLFDLFDSGFNATGQRFIAIINDRLYSKELYSGEPIIVNKHAQFEDTFNKTAKEAMLDLLKTSTQTLECCWFINRTVPRITYMQCFYEYQFSVLNILRKCTKLQNLGLTIHLLSESEAINIGENILFNVCEQLTNLTSLHYDIMFGYLYAHPQYIQNRYKLDAPIEKTCDHFPRLVVLSLDSQSQIKYPIAKKLVPILPKLKMCFIEDDNCDLYYYPDAENCIVNNFDCEHGDARNHSNLEIWLELNDSIKDLNTLFHQNSAKKNIKYLKICIGTSMLEEGDYMELIDLNVPKNYLIALIFKTNSQACAFAKKYCTTETTFIQRIQHVAIGATDNSFMVAIELFNKNLPNLRKIYIKEVPQPNQIHKFNIIRRGIAIVLISYGSYFQQPEFETLILKLKKNFTEVDQKQIIFEKCPQIEYRQVINEETISSWIERDDL